MWSATEPKVYPEISTHFYPCVQGLFGKQPDKWTNVVDNYDDFDIESKFGMIYVEDDNENSASFISSDNRHFHGGTYPLKNKVYQCGNEAEPDLPYPVVGVGFQREELIVACLISNNNIGFFKLGTNDKNVDEWDIVGTIYNEKHFFLNHVYFAKDGTKAVTIVTEKQKFEGNDIYIPFTFEISISYSGQAKGVVNINGTTINKTWLAPSTYKIEISAPFAVEYINNQLSIFNVKIDYVFGDYTRQYSYVLPPIESIDYWMASYYYAWFDGVTGEHWSVPRLYWWQSGYAEWPGLTVSLYKTKADNEIVVRGGGDFFSYNMSFNGFQTEKSIYTVRGLKVLSSLIYSTVGNEGAGLPFAPFYGPLTKIDLHANIPKIPSFLDGLFSGKYVNIDLGYLNGRPYSYFDTNISEKRYSYNIHEFTIKSTLLQGNGNYSEENEITINAQGVLLDTLNDKFYPRDSGLETTDSTRSLLLLVDLSQNLFVIGGKFGIKIIKNNEVIKEINVGLNVGRGSVFLCNHFDGGNDGVWGNIGIKYASKNQDYLLQIGDNKAIFNGNEINYIFEQIGVS